MKKPALLLSILLLILLFNPGIKANAATEKSLSSLDIVYDFNGSEYHVNRDLAYTMLLSNPDGTPYVDPATGQFIPDTDKIRTFLQALDTMYPRSSSITVFQATSGAVILIPSGQSATKMNYAAETAYLADAMNTGAVGRREMASGSSIGDTYVEINITEQRLYYYLNGVLQFASDIVTGNTSNGHSTPCGIYSIRAKQTAQTLVGAGYASYVNYWVPIIGNAIGIHDATWRSSFGGSIYTTNGSHGCINVPLNAMQQLYPMLQVGTPVVVFTQ